jgi:hypothetical protein
VGFEAAIIFPNELFAKMISLLRGLRPGSIGVVPSVSTLVCVMVISFGVSFEENLSKKVPTLKTPKPKSVELVIAGHMTNLDIQC